jgi:hypothetical protein
VPAGGIADADLPDRTAFLRGGETVRLATNVETRSLGFRDFLTQRDDVEWEKLPYEAVTPEERLHTTFHLDKTRVLEADVFVFVPDGRVPDEGGCVRLGIAYCQKELRNKEKLLVGLPTDARAAYLGSRLNPMLRVPLQYVAEDEQALLGAVSDHRASVERGADDER